MTLKGAQALLQKNKEGTTRTAEVLERLLGIKQQLTAIRDEMKAAEPEQAEQEEA